MTDVSVLVGAQWGDEGKGKWVDVLAKDTKITARYQGGNNAGHTLKIEDTTLVLHHLPSGILRQNHKAVLCAGMVINPKALLDELEAIKDYQTVSPANLLISARAHVITPWHMYKDAKQENEGNLRVGTTKKGIGPTYSDKTQRMGLRVFDFIDATKRKNWLELQKKEHKEFADFYSQNSDLWRTFETSADLLKPFVCDAEDFLRKQIKSGVSVLIEGAQGVLLDIEHGTYPFVTSSSTIAANACVSVGMDPRSIKKIYGIAKAYTTRVGEGPFPTELHDAIGKEIARKGKEFGATTKRPRRCGWLDLVALKYARDLNGFDEIFLNKIDILSGFSQIGVAVAYLHPTLGRLTTFPVSAEILKDCTPEYEFFAGWPEELPKNTTFNELPITLQNYVNSIEEKIEVPITMIGTGAGRDDFVERKSKINELRQS